MRRLVLTGAIVFGIVVLFFAHPYLLGLPGRIGEQRFENGLRIGMSVDDVTKLASATGGDTEFNFKDKITICDVEGDSVGVSFDKAGHVRSWFVYRKVFSCQPYQP
jgi:hypothetical protein